MATVLEVVTALATKQAHADADETTGSCSWVPPTTPEILDTLVVGASTHVWFVFDFLVRYGVQSGSDSYSHYVYTGTATIEGDAIARSKLEQQCQNYVTEFDYEWAPADQRYDCRKVCNTLRDAWMEDRLMAGDMP